MATKQEKTRYSDEELQEFKEIILAKIEQAQENYKRLTDTIMIDESNPTFKMMEEGASTLQKEVSSQQAERQLDFIRKLQGALVRIENKTYGDYIAHQVLANSITVAPVDATTAVELDMDGWMLPVTVDKI